MVIFHSYVSLPEGTYCDLMGCQCILMYVPCGIDEHFANLKMAQSKVREFSHSIDADVP